MNYELELLDWEFMLVGSAEIHEFQAGLTGNATILFADKAIKVSRSLIIHFGNNAHNILFSYLPSTYKLNSATYYMWMRTCTLLIRDTANMGTSGTETAMLWSRTFLNSVRRLVFPFLFVLFFTTSC